MDRVAALANFSSKKDKTKKINKINHNNPADIAQAQLVRNFLGGLNIGLRNGFFLGFITRKFTGVYINSTQGFRLLDNDTSAIRQRKFGLINGVLQFFYETLLLFYAPRNYIK